MASSKEFFIGNDKGPTIEEYINEYKRLFIHNLKWVALVNFEYEAATWWGLLNQKNCFNPPEEEFEKLLLDIWSHARKQYEEKYVGLFPTGISLLQGHGLIQKEKIMVSINPSCKHNFINVNLAKRLQVPAKQIENTQFDDEDVQIYKDLKLSMDKYMLHGDFYTSEMDNMDVVLGYPWMESTGTININVQKEFLKLWYKKKKITLHDISINKQVESTNVEVEYVPGTDI